MSRIADGPTRKFRIKSVQAQKRRSLSGTEQKPRTKTKRGTAIEAKPEASGKGPFVRGEERAFGSCRISLGVLRTAKRSKAGKKEPEKWR